MLLTTVCCIKKAPKSGLFYYCQILYLLFFTNQNFRDIETVVLDAAIGRQHIGID